VHEVLLRTSNGRRSITIDDTFFTSFSASEKANKDTIALFLASWVALLADSPVSPEKKPLKTYNLVLKQTQANGLKATVLRYADLAHKLVASATNMGSGTSIGPWIDDFADTPVFYEYCRYFKTGDPHILSFLYTFLNFGKKMEFVDDEFNKTAFRSWMGIEDRLSDLVLDADHVASLRLILRTVLPPFTIEDYRPKFGPGSVSEKKVIGRIGKIDNLRFDPLIDRFLYHGHIGMYGCGKDHGLDPALTIPRDQDWDPARGVSRDVGRQMFAPKNLKVARSVVMEPNTKMYHQQGIMREMLRLLDNSPLSRFIDIKDQSRNKDLALFGSLSSELDTIDLSAASDSLAYSLVKGIFPPSWLIPMIVTRTPEVQTPGGIIPIKKFAPMGSALCFPTQCIVFASVCIYAACRFTYDESPKGCSFLEWLTPECVLRVAGLFSQQPGYYRGAFQPLAVYGDDICVDGRLTHTVKSILSDLGFEVNEEKSFVASQAFRESCGGFYLGGSDITPLYFRIKGIRGKLTAGHIASHVHMINESFERGYKKLYSFLLHSLMTWDPPVGFKRTDPRKNSIPFVTNPEQFGIRVASDPKNLHLRTRYHKDYQRDEMRQWTISYDWSLEPTDKQALDKYEYMRWWASRTSEEITARKAVSRFDTGGPGLRWRWIPVQ
jgi:hypothetical protein